MPHAIAFTYICFCLLLKHLSFTLLVWIEGMNMIILGSLSKSTKNNALDGLWFKKILDNMGIKKSMNSRFCKVQEITLCLLRCHELQETTMCPSDYMCMLELNKIHPYMENKYKSNMVICISLKKTDWTPESICFA